MNHSKKPNNCPICNGNNNCRAKASDGPCWCFTDFFPKDILQSIDTNNTCVCQSCLNTLKEKQLKQ